MSDMPTFDRQPFELQFVNRSTRSVGIKKIVSSCGCTVLDEDLHGSAVEPGETISITGRIDAGARPGHFQRRVDLFTDDDQLFSAFVHYNVVATYTLQPTVVDFGRVDPSDSDFDDVRTALFRSDTATLGEPSVDSPWLEAATHERSSGETEIVIHARKEYPVYGKHVGRVVIPTSDPNHPSVVILAQVDCVQALRPVPAHVFLRGDEVQTVRLVDDAGEAAPVAKAWSDCLDLSVTVDAASVSVTNARGANPDEAVVVWVVDDRDRRTSFLVHVMEP